MQGGKRGVLLPGQVALSCYPREEGVGLFSSTGHPSLTHRFTSSAIFERLPVELGGRANWISNVRGPHQSLCRDSASSGPIVLILQLTHVVHQGPATLFQRPRCRNVSIQLQISGPPSCNSAVFSVEGPTCRGKTDLSHPCSHSPCSPPGRGYRRKRSRSSQLNGSTSEILNRPSAALFALAPIQTRPHCKPGNDLRPPC